jgi:reverse transcriptase-like protein
MTAFIDNIMLAGSDCGLLDTIVKDLSQHFKLRDLGPTTQLLGLKIYRDYPNHHHLFQGQYIINLHQKHGMQDCKPVSTPLNPGLCLSTSMFPQNNAKASEM